MRPSRFVAITVVCLALGSGCAHLPKPDGEPGPSKRDSLYLDPSPASRLVIELDRIEGANPRPRALAIFLERLNKTLDKPGGIDLVVEPPVPRDRWEPDPPKIRKLARELRSIPIPSDDVVPLHVLYAPRLRKFRGYTWMRSYMSRGAPDYGAAFLLILREPLKPILWITGVRQEAGVLLHEAGHALGLASNPGHSTKLHCTNAWCLMYDGVDARTFFLYFFPTLFTGYLPLDYCRDCRRDLWPETDGKKPVRR